METYFADVKDPKELIWMEARDHFFAGGLDELEEAVFQVVGQFEIRS